MKMPDPRLHNAAEKALQEEMRRSGRRLVIVLKRFGPMLAGLLANRAQVSNLSHAVAHVNPILAKHGLQIINYPPHKPRLNRFGEPTNSHIWELVLTTEGGNYDPAK